jgi:hypothetical protein
MQAYRSEGAVVVVAVGPPRASTSRAWARCLPLPWRSDSSCCLRSSRPHGRMYQGGGSSEALRYMVVAVATGQSEARSFGQ